MSPVANVLFVSAENAVRSQLAEACLRHVGKARFNAFSCGVPGKTATTVSPVALEVLHRAGMPIARLAAKSWEQFLAPGGTRIDIIVALDGATVHSHPAWPWQAHSAQWDYPPLLHTLTPVSNRVQQAEQTLHSLRRRVELVMNLHDSGKLRREYWQGIGDASPLVALSAD
ncbi:hypothetical protein LJR066_003077 [Acidovorax sp. LjRoot66]|uniref:arsenate-mycothiol transferase ArsC n=1 Tax=Acidovorax sp. LjRoot66 TaxID=3342334 RepID=UPI003ECE5BEF